VLRDFGNACHAMSITQKILSSLQQRKGLILFHFNNEYKETLMWFNYRHFVNNLWSIFVLQMLLLRPWCSFIADKISSLIYFLLPILF